jgi:ADP-ribose pyrophosphatase YjhB (NUDIX family)
LPSDLGRFLAGYAPDDVQMVEWGAEGNPGPLRVAGYLSRELPPLPYVTSVRAVVSRGDLVLVMRNRDGVHILPGGQREPGETLVQTLEREVLEEAGWTIDVRGRIGFLHFRHLGPRPPGPARGVPALYPDFAQVEFLAEALASRPGARMPGDHELESSFKTIAEALELGSGLARRLFLEEANRVRDGG